jgi:hypothetical protein
MSAEPIPQIADKGFRVCLKLQCMPCVWVFENLQVRRPELFHQSPRSNVVDNPIATGQHEKDRNVYLSMHTPDQAIQPNALDEQASCGVPQGKRIVPDEILPFGCIREQLRVIKGNLEAPSRADKSRQGDPYALAERRSHARAEPGT